MASEHSTYSKAVICYGKDNSYHRRKLWNRTSNSYAFA